VEARVSPVRLCHDPFAVFVAEQPAHRLTAFENAATLANPTLSATNE